MTFPTRLLSQKSINALQIFRHKNLNGSIFNEITRGIYLPQLIMSKNLQRVDGFLQK
jgi:hypothetical protein